MDSEEAKSNVDNVNNALRTTGNSRLYIEERLQRDHKKQLTGTIATSFELC
jgi:hypothetical protein